MTVEPIGPKDPYSLPFFLPDKTSDVKQSLRSPDSLLPTVRRSLKGVKEDDIVRIEGLAGGVPKENRVSELLEKTENIPLAIPNLEEVVNENASILTQAILGKKEMADSVQTLTANLSELSNPLVEFGKEFVADLLEKSGEEVFNLPKDLVTEIADDIFIAELANAVPQTITGAALLIYKRSLLSAMKKHIQNAELNPEKKEVLQLWLKKQDIKLRKEATAFGLKRLAYAPRATKLVLKLTDKLPSSFAVPYLWVLGIFVSALYFYKARQLSKSLDSQKEWMKALRAPSYTSEQIQTIIDARADQFQYRKTEFDTGYDRLVNGLTWENRNGKLEKMPHPKLMNAKTAEEFEQALRNLEVTNELQMLYSVAQSNKFDSWMRDLTWKNRKEKLAGIDYPELKDASSQADFQNILQETQTQNDLRLLFAEHHFNKWVQEITWENKEEKLAEASHPKLVDPVDKEAFLEALQEPEVRSDLRILFAREQYAKHKETVRVMTRNALKAQALNKHKAERKFLKFELSRTKIAGSALILNISVMAVLKTLAIATIIAVPTIALTLSGVGLFIISAALLLAGLYMLYRYRPNLMKELAKGTAIRVAFYEIPAQIQKVRLAHQRLKKIEKFWSVTMLPENEKEKMNHRIKEIDEKIEKLEGKVKKWEEKLQPLQNRLKTARWKDYLRKVKGQNVNEILVESLFEDPGFSVDPETQVILRKHFGFRLEQIQQLPDEQKKEVEKMLLQFFTMDEKATAAFIQQQKEQEELKQTLQRETP